MGNLSYQPGVDKITIGNGIGKPVIRGLSFNQILLYGQGTRIEISSGTIIMILVYQISELKILKSFVVRLLLFMEPMQWAVL